MKFLKNLKDCMYTAFLLLFVVFVFSSCASMAKSFFMGSIDYVKEKQGGNSADVTDPDFLINFIGLVGIRRFPMADVEREAAVHYEEDLSMQTNTSNSASYFRLTTGLEFIQKGYLLKDVVKVHIRRNYLEVPLYATWVHPFSSGSFYAGAGPYFAYGIGGKIKSSGFSGPVFGEDNGGYKRFDAGISALAGYEFDNGIAVHLAYDFGLANIAYASQDITAHNRSLSLNFGYEVSRLIKKKK